MRNRPRPTRRRLVTAVALLLVIVGGMGVPAAEAGIAAPRVQVATATAGTYAQGGTGYVDFPDGSTRWFTAMLVVPEGVVTGTPAVEDADLREPWAIVSERAWDRDDPGGGLSGGSEVCHRLVNPASFHPGHSGPRATWPASGPKPTWEGMYFDVTCDDGAGYDFYRVHFDNYVSPWSGRESFIHRRSATGHPLTDARYWGWSAPYRVNGLIEADPGGVQSAATTVCGHRWEERVGEDGVPFLEEVVDCYGPGLGRIMVDVTALNAQMYVVAE